MYRRLTGKICAWRDWEVLDEGVGGSLTTHLQEVLPCCKGEQSLTFKRYQRSTVARWEPKWELKIVLATCWQLIYYPDVWNKPERFEIETPKTHLYHFTISLWSWTTENLDLLLFSYQKTLACYRNNQLPVREGDKRAKKANIWPFMDKNYNCFGSK